MIANRVSKGRISLSLESNEATCIINVLNEVLHGFPMTNFNKLIGMSRVEAIELLRNLKIRALNAGIPFDLTFPEFLSIRQALNESMRELGMEEFHTRVGVSLQNGKEISEAIDSTYRALRAQEQKLPDSYA